MTITIVGLGPGDPSLLTLEADRVLRSSPVVYFRTSRHPVADYLREAGIEVRTFDEVYEAKGSYAEVYQEIAERLIALQEGSVGDGGLVYAVPGHPLVGEAVTSLLLAHQGPDGLDIRIVDGLSLVEPALTLLGLDLLDGLQIVDATDLILRPYPALSTDQGVLICDISNREIGGDVKLALGGLFPDEHAVMLVRDAGTPDQHVSAFPLFELDRQPFIDHATLLYVPPLGYPSSWAGLQTIVAQLRAPGGCPWDREQTHRSLRTHLLDEAYEVLDALDREDTQDLCVELGDLALQIALHLQIAMEEGEFRPSDVFGNIIAKLRRRHPHVFGDVKVGSAEDVMVNWEDIKRREKGARDLSRQLEGVPASLPALSQALTYQERAARVGYDVEDGARLSRLIERWVVVERQDEAEVLLGEVLFALVATARLRGINPESALREANGRFASQFQDAQRADKGD